MNNNIFVDGVTYNITAEQMIISEIMQDNKLVYELYLTDDDFYREAHKLIINAMVDLIAEGRPADTLNIVDKLTLQSQLNTVGGPAYINSLFHLTFNTRNFESHANIIKECSVKRKLLRCTTSLLDRITSGEETIESVLSDVQDTVAKLSLQRESEKEIKTVGDLYCNSLAELKDSAGQEFTGLQTGYIDFDRMTGGLRNSDLIVLAARPAMGKTALALNIAQNIVDKGGSAMVVSLEMSGEQLSKRLLSSLSGVEGSKMRQPKLIDNGEWKALAWAYEKHKRDRMQILDEPNLTPDKIRLKAKKMKKEIGLDLIVIDYLQLMTDGKNHKGDRIQEVSAISRALKLMARELDVPVIALSQLSRSVESRMIKKPMLSDLRESGAIEQDADLVMFLYRDKYYNPDTTETHTELIIAKHRHGPVGTVNLYFDEAHTLFKNLSKEEYNERGI